MIIKVHNKKYKIKSAMATSSKILISKILENIRMNSEMHGMPEYYIAFVVMMYTVSSSILKKLTPREIEKIAAKKPR